MTTKNPAAQLLGSLGGKARAAKSSPEKLQAVAKLGAAARWKNHIKKPRVRKKAKPPIPSDS